MKPKIITTHITMNGGTVTLCGRSFSKLPVYSLYWEEKNAFYTALWQGHRWEHCCKVCFNSLQAGL